MKIVPIWAIVYIFDDECTVTSNSDFCFADVVKNSEMNFVSASSLKYFELFCELPHVGGKDFYQQQKNYRKKFLSPNVNNYDICFLHGNTKVLLEQSEL